MPSGYKHGDNTKKAMVRGTISYLESQGLPVNKNAIFRHFELSRSQGYAALSLPASKGGDPEWEETRGRPSKLPEADIRKVEAILWDPQYEQANLNWTSLAKEAAIETKCNRRTLHRAMGTLGYRLCLTRGCGRQWMHSATQQKRQEYASRMLQSMPNGQADWRKVRFSGELHFGFGLDGRMRLLPRAGERRCPSCQASQGEGAEWPRDIRRVHAWAAVGYGFKSELVFYAENMSPNNSGVMSVADYKSKILEGVVKGWLEPGKGKKKAKKSLKHGEPAIEEHGVSAEGQLLLLPQAQQAQQEAQQQQHQQQQSGAQEQQPQLQQQPQPQQQQYSSFILAEDVDTLSHGNTFKTNPAQKWKETHGLRYLANCSESPDLSPLDAAVLWPGEEIPKQWTMPKPVKEWEAEELHERVREVWGRVEQEKVDWWVDGMTERLRAVLDLEGKMVLW